MDKMRSVVKSILKRTCLYDLLRDFAIWRNEAKNRRKDKKSETWGLGPSPSEEVKQRTVRAYAERFHLTTFVETGTYEGEMVDAVKTCFKKIYSVELSSALFERAKDRFKLYEHITMLRGDSGEILPNLLSDLRSPVLFWLDAHYSHGVTARGDLETPILRELGALLHHEVSGHVILIDDARLFTGDHDYPTAEQVRQFVLSSRPELKFSIHDDIMRIHP